MIGVVRPREDGRRLGLALLGRAIGRPPGGSDRERVLVVRPDHLGDVLFLTPALRQLRRGLPRARIVALVGTWGEPVLRHNPHLDGLLTWDFPWFDRQPRGSALAPYRSLAALAARLRAERFDLALQFRDDFWWGALAVRLAGLPEQVGFDVPIVRPFLSRSVPLAPGRHVADENRRLVAAVVGDDGRGDGLEFPVEPAARWRAAELLGAVAADRPLIALQVGAGAPVKLWPRDRLAAVGRALTKRCRARLVVLGGAGERAAVEEVVAKVGGDAIGLAGRTTVDELAAVLERCALALGPDSGPLHLAVAVGTPTLHLFGPADPRRFGPYGDPFRHRVVAARRACAPCNRLAFEPGELGRHDCLATIEVGEVVEQAVDLLDEAHAKPRG